jgi:hypothetical protein
MNFKTASVIESLTWTMRLADFPRAQNRARINSLFDGSPPYSDQEERENNVAVNVNFLEATKVGHDARQQFANAFQKPGKFFTARTDFGPAHKRQKWSSTVSNQVNRILKRSPAYFENMRSKFALLVLHGIAPSTWENSYNWCPITLGVEDVMIPSGTLLTLKNLPFFAVYRAYTAEELYRLTHGPKVDPGWKMDNVMAAIKWADAQCASLSGTTWPEVWSPDKMEQRIKEDSGLYASDAVPVISCWDFYWWNDSKKVQGWNRRIVLDAFGQPGVGGVLPDNNMRDKNIIGGRNQFLFDPGDKCYAQNISEILQFQFGDLSAVAPFRYHAVRSLGFLLYAVCHLQNRLRCKFNEAVFETLMMYMRVKSLDEAERALKINLISRGIIDDSVQFLNPSERWMVNERLAQIGLVENQQIINDNSSSYTQSQNFSKPNVEKTAFQVRAELNATTALISAALLQAYQYQTFEYNEIFRRFCAKDPRDPDVRAFRLACLKEGVPPEVLVPEAWDIEPERVMGSGNKTLELATAQTLMEWRPLYDPEAQREILRMATLAVSDDPGATEQLVPETADKVTDSKHDAMVAMGSLMMGLPVQFGPRVNRIEVTEVLLSEMAMIIQRIEQQQGAMATQEQLIGLQMVGQTIGEQLQIIAQDKSQKERVRQYSDALGQMMNMVKAYGQRLQEAMQQAAQQNGQQQMDPKDMAKVQAMQLQAQTKAANSRESHAQKTAQKQVQWEAGERRKQQEHQVDMVQRRMELQTDVMAKDVETAAEIRRENAKAANEPKETAE